jgi:hypothetical protein
MVSFHQSIPTFVAVEPMLDLQSRNNEVDEIEEQEHGEIAVGLATNCICAFRYDRFL